MIVALCLQKAHEAGAMLDWTAGRGGVVVMLET
jgi:hypothetical protein